MGLESVCKVRFQGQSSPGKARLQAKDLTFSGRFRLQIPFTDIRGIAAERGKLRVEFAGGPAEFELGPQAEKWALKIRYPRPLLDKLGVKAGQSIGIAGKCDDAAFLKQMRARTANIATGNPRRGSDIIFLFTADARDLARLPRLRACLQPAGAIWVLWPKPQKGKPSPLKEADVRRAALGCGLVDVKVVSFSETRSGLKLVVPVAKRG